MTKQMNVATTQPTHYLSVRCETGEWVTYCRGSRMLCEMAIGEALKEEAYLAYEIIAIES